MESIDQVWLFVAIALCAGVVLGALLHRMFSSSPGDADKLRAELERTRSEMERYRASVNSHFSKTSDLVSELTQDYVKVYQHLAEGAQTLSDSPEFTQMLEQSEGRVLISVEDEIPEQKPVVVEAPVEVNEATPPEDARLHRGNAAAEQTGDSDSPVAADDELIEAADERKDPVIGDANQGADIDQSISPAAQQPDTAQQDSDSDSVRRS